MDDRHTAVLGQLARAVSTANYRRRREALWSLSRETWQEITDRLPPVPGPAQPNLDDRKRQEASAFIWAQVSSIVHSTPLSATRLPGAICKNLLTAITPPRPASCRARDCPGQRRARVARAAGRCSPGQRKARWSRPPARRTSSPAPAAR